VVVTQAARRSTSPAASSDKTPSPVQEDTDKLKAPASASQRIWNLLPVSRFTLRTATLLPQCNTCVKVESYKM
jgi:hypothetical protein